MGEATEEKTTSRATGRAPHEPGRAAARTARARPELPDAGLPDAGLAGAGLAGAGLTGVRACHAELSSAALYEHALARGEARLSAAGALVAETGENTGRRPEDRYIVDEPGSRELIDWGPVNRPLAEASFERLLARMRTHFAGREAFLQTVSCGADPAHRLTVRVVAEEAWHALFARIMFRPASPLSEARSATGSRTKRSSRIESANETQWSLLHAPSLIADPERDGTRSAAFIVLHPGRRMILIGGTRYAGEIKKSIFSVMNLILPGRGVLPLHCAANIGESGDVALFFGLSGTGKTTLSADHGRRLIGDDEHGWSESGVFNFEGGCYAKTLGLDAAAEPEIWQACQRFGAILENVALDPDSRAPDFLDGGRTENGRAAYPLAHMPEAVAEARGGPPGAVIMLSCDAFGVLPPLARLTPEQAMIHFLSGYTAKMAGTERGVSAPQACFSACFGAPFMPRPAPVYAELLRARLEATGAQCWLINTGWSGGGVDSGSRIPLAHTRALVRAALDGALAETSFHREPHFGLWIPESCPDVPAEMLDPRRAWADAQAHGRAAADLARRFRENFARFEAGLDVAVCAALPPGDSTGFQAA